jgi:hypothetical protein
MWEGGTVFIIKKHFLTFLSFFFCGISGSWRQNQPGLSVEQRWQVTQMTSNNLGH